MSAFPVWVLGHLVLPGYARISPTVRHTCRKKRLTGHRLHLAPPSRNRVSLQLTGGIYVMMCREVASQQLYYSYGLIVLYYISILQKR